MFDPKVYRNSKDGIGSPGDARATDATDNWTTVSLLKGLYYSFNVTGITVTFAAGNLGTGTATNALRTVTASDSPDVTSLASMDSKLSTLNFNTDTLESALGVLAETAPATDTASSGLNGRLQRVAQRLTSLIALVPASLGAKAAASSLAVTQSTEDAAQLGSLTETAPASDTASSGLNGRLQRIAQRLTSLIALVPASLGQKAMTASMAVVVASDQTTFPVSPGATSVTGGISTTARLAAAAASTNATNVKTSAGRIYSAQGYNAAAYTVYLVLYDSASNPPVPGTTTIRKKIPIPATTAFALDWPVGLSFATGIGYAFTKLPADADTTVLVASDILQFNLDYV